MVTINDGEVLSAQKINDNLNHTLLEPKAYAATVGGAAATATATYFKVGKRVEVEFSITFNGAATGTVTLTTPSDMSASAVASALGVAFGLDGGAAATRRSFTVIGLAGGKTVAFNVDSLTTNALVNAATPWTWATSDTITGRFTYWEA